MNFAGYCFAFLFCLAALPTLKAAALPGSIRLAVKVQWHAHPMPQQQQQQINGITKADRVLQFSRQSTEQDARDEALRTCVKETHRAECKVIHVACSAQVFHTY